MGIANLGLDTAVARFGAATLPLSDEDLARDLPDEVMAGLSQRAGLSSIFGL